MRSRFSSNVKPQLYTSFAGLNTSRDAISMERPESQPMLDMDNLYCSAKGFISNESPTTRAFPTEFGYISHLKLLSPNNSDGVYVVSGGAGVSLRAMERPLAQNNVWPKGTVVSSALFNSRVILAGGGSSLYSYDGAEFRQITSPSINGGRYLAQVQNRLIVAGFDANPNEVVMSRVNNESLYADDESPDDTSVTRGARFNVQNLIGNGDRIRGVSPYEANKCAILTGDRVLVYIADPDLTLWTLDTRVVVRYGTISNRAVVNVGDELFFCSRIGVHSIRRSGLNGSTIFTTPMSDDIQELYQSLLAKVQNKEDISAYFNTDEGRLHIFFPVNNLICYRLSAALSPALTEDSAQKIRWSLSTFMGMTCGDTLNGVTYHGSTSGLYQVNQWFSNNGDRGAGWVKTPILWHKDFFNAKQSEQLVMYASGAGKIKVETWDEAGRQLSTVLFELPDTDQADYTGVPLQRQFTRPFAHEYVGVQMKITVDSDKVVRIFGIGVLTKEN